MRRDLAVLVLLAILPVVSGCGNERTPVPDVRHADAPSGTRTVDLPQAGVRFTAPQNWPGLTADGPRAGGIQSKTATLAVWRYPRTEPLPATAADLDAAKGRLEQRVRERDPSFELQTSTVTKLAGADAIELTGRQTVAGLRFGVRSAHVFADGAEVVVDAYAPPEDFPRVDASVFQPALRSLEVGGP